jgi:dihydrofolate synthase/folylpolyglutamate synthase
VAVVTPIGLDHVGLLGDTVGQIAAEKAGIVHEGATLVSSSQLAEAQAELDRRAVDVGATVRRQGLDFAVTERTVAVGGQLLTIDGLGGVYDGLFLPLHGAHQGSNAATALAAIEAFFGAGERGPLDIETVREGFAQATSPGRLEVVRRGPTVLLDGAHNPAGAAALATALEDEFDFERLVAVVAVLDDKDAAGLLSELERVADEVVVTTNASPRALPAAALAAVAAEVFGDSRVTVAARLDDAIERAVALAETGPLGGGGVLVTGSIVTVGEARTLLGGRT